MRSRSGSAGVVLMGVICAGATACNSVHTALSDLTPAVITRGEAEGFSTPLLAQGRELFVARCAHCHALPAVDSSSRSDWEGILPRMARKSGLDPAQAAAVRAFVVTVRGTGE